MCRKPPEPKCQCNRLFRRMVSIHIARCDSESDDAKKKARRKKPKTMTGSQKVDSTALVIQGVIIQDIVAMSQGIERGRIVHRSQVEKKERFIGGPDGDQHDPLQRESPNVGPNQPGCCGPFGAHTHPILVGRVGIFQGPNP